MIDSPLNGIVRDLRSLADNIELLVASTNGTADNDAQKVISSVSMSEVRMVLSKLSRAGHTADVQALIRKFGADRLSEVAPENYQALLAEAEVMFDAA